MSIALIKFFKMENIMAYLYVDEDHQQKIKINDSGVWMNDFKNKTLH